MPSSRNSRVLMEINLNRLIEAESHGKPSNEELSKMFDCSTACITDWRSHPYYKKRKAETIARAEKSADGLVRENTRELRLKLSEWCTASIDTIVGIMKDKKEPGKTRLLAACEILDRDGRFAKVSRQMVVRQGEDGAPMVAEDVAAQLMAAFDKPTERIQ